MNSLDDIFNNASVIVSSNDDREVCASYVALLYVGRKRSELSFKKSQEEILHPLSVSAKTSFAVFAGTHILSHFCALA